MLQIAFTILCVIPITLTAAEQEPFWIKTARERIQRVKSGHADKSILDEPLEDPFLPQSLNLLHLAIEHDYSLMYELLAAGANPDACDGTLQVPLDRAGSKIAVTALLNAGADPKKSRNSILQVYCYYRFNHPAQRIIPDHDLFNEELETYDKLFNAGADPTHYWGNLHPIRTSISNSFEAIEQREQRIFFFITRGCRIDVPVEKNNRTPLMEWFQRNEPGWHTFIASTYEKYRQYQTLVKAHQYGHQQIARLPKELLALLGTFIMALK